MSELVSCATETALCSVCGRTQNQTTYCTLVKQAVGTFNYIQASTEERVHGPHIL